MVWIEEEWQVKMQLKCYPIHRRSIGSLHDGFLVPLKGDLYR